MLRGPRIDAPWSSRIGCGSASEYGLIVAMVVLLWLRFHRVSGRLVSAVDEQVSGKARQLHVIGLALQYRIYVPTAPPNNVTTPRHYQHDERPLPDAASLRRWPLRVA
jgi:hypothetical protein